jgi:drug/metabolite transporter (DMT)-like permease
MTLTIIFWSNAFIAIKFGLRELSPLGLTALRFILASAFFLIALLLFPKSRIPTSKELPLLLVLALLGGASYHILLNYGEQFVPAGTASLIIGSSPIFTAILASIFLKEKLGSLGILGIAISFSGLFLISWQGTPNGLGMGAWQGFLAILGASISWSSYPILAKRIVANRGPLFVSAYTHFLALPFLLVFTSGSFYAKLPSLGAQVWIAVLFLAIFCTFLGYIFYNRALPILGATATSTYSYLVPVLALFFSWLILKEQINWFIALGAMLVISGVAITNWALQFRNRPPAEVANKDKILKKEGLPTDEARSRLDSS